MPCLIWVSLSLGEALRSPWARPIFLIKKSDGSDQFICHFGGLNVVTEIDDLLSVRFDCCIDVLHCLIYFSSTDLHTGFWQLPLDPATKHLTSSHLMKSNFSLMSFASGWLKCSENLQPTYDFYTFGITMSTTFCDLVHPLTSTVTAGGNF